MSWQAETGSSGLTPGAANPGLGRSYLRDLKTLGNGRYRIINLAGKGGMSQVFHAYDTLNDRDVAIKVLSLDLASEETFLDRFQRESELMRDFNHPNILRAYDYGQEEDRVYLVMSYYGGGTLKDRLNQGPLTFTQIADYLTQIAAGLGYAHSRNIVHRDIKPSNVLIHHAGDNLVLSDFGIARALSNANPARTGTIMGTPLYMAPEQFLDKADQRSDIYSLGIVLYQMLTGEVPFKGEGIGFKHLYDQVPPLKTWNVNYDPVIENVVVQALAKRPEARFQTVGEMALAFKAAVSDFARRDTLDALKGLAGPVGNTTWNSLEGDPAVLPGQASLSSLPVITPSQLKTGNPVNLFYLEQTAPLSLQELQRFENEPLPFNVLNRHPGDTSHPGPAAVTEPEFPAPVSGKISRAYIPMQFQEPDTRNSSPVPQAVKGKVSPVKKAAKKRAVPPAAAPKKSGGPGPAPPAGPHENVPASTRRTGFKWWFLAIPLILIIALALLAFSLAGGLALGGSPVPAVTTIAAETGAASPVTTTAPTGIANPTAASSAQAGTVPVKTASAQTTAPSGRNAVILFTSEYNSEGTYNIYSYDTQTRAIRQLTLSGKDSLPTWAPDGSKIAFQRELASGAIEIWEMAPDGNNQNRLLSGGMNPEFAHTSMRLVYVDVKQNEIYMVSADQNPAQAPIKLTSTDGKPKRGPAFSYDDKKIAFAMEDDQKLYQIFTLDLTNPKAVPVKLTDKTGENAMWPNFSPDGTQLVYSTNDNNPKINERLPLDIYMINVDGSGSQRLVGNTGRNSHPVWVPDSSTPYGSRIFFNSDRGAAEWARIYSMNPVADTTKADQRLFFEHKQSGQEAPYNNYAPAVFFKK